MMCISCGKKTKLSTTTDVTDIGGSLIIVRNVPCYKCVECNETIYTADVIKRLERIVEIANKAMNEIAVVDYNHQAA